MSHRPQLGVVHHGPAMGTDRALAGAEASLRCGARGLATIGGKDRGDSREPHRWYKMAAERWRTAGDEEDDRWGVEIVGAALRVRRESVASGVGCGAKTML
jgi:hypothetical protein